MTTTTLPEIKTLDIKPDIYIPPNCYTLDRAEANLQIRLGLQGPPGIGKTYNGCSFPNTCVISYDRGLGAHFGRKDIVEIPFWDDAYIDKLCPRKTPLYVEFGTGVKKTRPFNRKEALLKWLYDFGPKFTANQTLMLDGSTGIQAAFHSEYWTDPAIDKDGKLKPYEEFKRKLSYFTEIMMCIKALKCHVIYICHECDDRNDEGEKNGRIRPLMSGAFKDELISHFTDWFRCHAFDKPTTEAGKLSLQKATNCSKEDLEYWISESKSETIYLWQTESDNLAICKTSTLVGNPKYVLADYKTFERYRRKIST